MAKRNATAELTRDNWNEEDENEEAGTFTPVSGSELQNRVIKKAKRTLNSPSGNPQGTSPFARFAGFTASTTNSSPFRSVKNNVATNNPLLSASKDEEKTNGNSVGNSDKSSENLTKDSKITVSSTLRSSDTSVQENEGRNIEHYRQLQSLNQSVLKWMQLHLAKNPCCDFTPVFNDYKKHLDTLNVTYPVKKKESIESKTSDVCKISSSASSNDPSKVKNNSTLPKSSVFLTAKDSSKDDETDYGANFKSNTTNTSTFSFGIKSTPTATSPASLSGPTSSVKEEEEKKSTSDFSFGYFNKPFQANLDKPFSFATAPTVQNSESGEKEDQEYVPPKNEFVAVAEEDAFYSKRCKLFFMKGDSYAEKGVGTLYLKSLEGKTQLLIRADTNLGNILLNIMLSASLPMSRKGKNNVLLVCIPNPPLDAKNSDSKEPIPTLIRVKTAEDADELLETLNKHKS